MVDERVLWAASVAVSLAFAAFVGRIWYVASTSYEADRSQLATAERVEQVLAAHDLAFGREDSDKEPPIYVRTGLFIQSLAFTSAWDVNFSGYIWQIYVDGVHDGLSQGFVLPEAVESPDTMVMEEAYRRPMIVSTKDGVRRGEVVGWYVEATLRQRFDYRRYPLDLKEVWIRMWHEDFDRNVILVPDLGAYASTLPDEAFGLDEQIVLAGWVIEESYFRYRLSSYDTNFGIPEYVGQRNFPELYFDVIIRRNFLNAFVVNLVPLLVVAALLFAVLMTITSEPTRVARLGFDTTQVLAATSALFFVVLLAHIQLREQLETDRVVYLELFYLLVYVALLGVAVNTYLFSVGSGRVARLLHWRDNLVPKLTFWPLLTGTALLFTWWSLAAL